MDVTPTPLADCYVITPTPSLDQRGWFMRTYCKKDFAQINPNLEWVQMNHSCTHARGTIRGLHYQRPPHLEIKLVRCISGAVWDVIVDLRQGSSTFLKWFAVELSATNHRMLYIAGGVAHGFQTLSDDCQLLYHHSASYTPTAEGGIRFDDPKIGIAWPLPPTCVSSRDMQHPPITDDFEGLRI